MVRRPHNTDPCILATSNCEDLGVGISLLGLHLPHRRGRVLSFTMQMLWVEGVINARDVCLGERVRNRIISIEVDVFFSGSALASKRHRVYLFRWYQTQAPAPPHAAYCFEPHIVDNKPSEKFTMELPGDGSGAHLAANKSRGTPSCSMAHDRRRPQPFVAISV